MIGIQPLQLLRIQQRQVQQTSIEGHQGQRLETIHRRFQFPLHLCHHDQVFAANTKGAVAVVTGFITDDHAGLQGHRGPGLGNALWALVHAQESANPVAGAMIVFVALPPQKLARQHIQVGTRSALGEARPIQGNVAFQHQGKQAPHLGTGIANGHGAGDVRGAVVVLAAGIDQVYRVRWNLGGGAVAVVVVAHGGIAAGGGDGVKGGTLEMLAAGPEVQQAVRQLGLVVQAPGGLLAIQPGQKPHHSRAITDVGAAGAGNLYRILAGFGHDDRVSAGHQRGTTLLQQPL